MLLRAAVVVEDRYSQVFAQDRVRPVVADGLAELVGPLVDHPDRVPQDHALAEEWTYRYLAAAQTWPDAEHRGSRRSRPRRRGQHRRGPG